MHQEAILDEVERERATEIEAYFDRLWPLLRSITGDGVRKTHDILGELIPLERIEVPTGTPVFDWTVPPEWMVREAYVTTPDGRRILDVADNNLYLVNYSTPFRGKVSRAELDAHLTSIPEMPDAVPYVTSYYKERWGFCITHTERQSLPDGEYEVVIDTDHIDGALTISECVLEGETDREVLFSTYTCHPSLANNELSGPLVTAFLYRRLAQLPRRRLTYRFVFLPETIGSICYLARMGEHLKKNLVAGYVVSCVGRESPFSYQRSRNGNTLADRAASCALRSFEKNRHVISPFVPNGSDERQYCSPGFDLPVGVLSRGFWGYPEYHTSLDDKKAVSFAAMRRAVDLYFATSRILDRSVVYTTTNPHCEPQLGKHGLYPSSGGARRTEEDILYLLWVLNQSDGTCDLLEIAERHGLDYWKLAKAAESCNSKGLLETT